MPTWSKAVLLAQAVILLPIGAALFVAPERADSLWPWTLTTLTGRAVGAWLLGIGVGLVHATIEGDLRRTRPGLTAYAVLGAFQLLAIARYPGDVDWGAVKSWVYLAFVVSVFVAGVLGLAGAARAERSPTGQAFRS